MKTNLMPALQTALRLLFFRVSREEMLLIDRRHLALGLLFTWLAGIGRTWDSSEAALLQRLGVGSVVYVFVLALLVWLTVKPLSRVKISYFHILTFICLTSPPALIYAIPVEQFSNAATAHQINIAFLCIVATWRVALLLFYLGHVLGLKWFQNAVSTLLMFCTIIAPLTLLRVATKVATAMSGARDGHNPNDIAYQVVMIIGMVSVFAFLPLLLAYQILVGHHKATEKQRANEAKEIAFEKEFNT